MRAHTSITARPRGLGRVLAVVAFLAVAAPAPAVLSGTAACAATPRHAALVIDTGSRELSYCVAIPGTIDGIELIRLANRQYGLQYALGFGGEAVCQLAGVGVTGGDCFADFPRFWGYWHGAPAGGWSWSSVGAGSVSVSPGDVEGWSWGTGQDGSSHPQPPVTPLDSVCEPPSTPPPTGGGDGGGGTGDGHAGGGGGAGEGPGSPADPGGDPQGTGEGNTDTGTPPAGRDGGSATQDPDASGSEPGGSDPQTPFAPPSQESAVEPEADTTPLSAMAPTHEGSELLPVGPIVSLLAVAMLLAGGAFLAWKRRGG